MRARAQRPPFKSLRALENGLPSVRVFACVCIPVGPLRIGSLRASGPAGLHDGYVRVWVFLVGVMRARAQGLHRDYLELQERFIGQSAPATRIQLRGGLYRTVLERLRWYASRRSHALPRPPKCLP